MTQTLVVTVCQFETSSRGVHPIQATGQAFAAILEDGCDATGGGDTDFGGDSLPVRDQLEGVWSSCVCLLGVWLKHAR